jgi:hypothetical protein
VDLTLISFKRRRKFHQAVTVEAAVFNVDLTVEILCTLRLSLISVQTASSVCMF